MNIVLLIAFLWCFSNVNCTRLSYKFESKTTDGKYCLTDCVNGKCWISYRDEGHCTPGTKKAATYYTSLHKSVSLTCVSKCTFSGYDYSWCYVDNDFNWDYCSSRIQDTNEWYQYSRLNGRCKDNCTDRGYRGGRFSPWCYTKWADYEDWDYCDETSYYEDKAATIYGYPCYTKCQYYSDGYYCYDWNRSKQKCAPSAVRYECPSVRLPRSSDSPRRTVEEYNREIEANVSNKILTKSLIDDIKTYVSGLDYTYRTTENGIRLPVKVRAFIRPYSPYHHLRESSTRRSKDIYSSYSARQNCSTVHACLDSYDSDQIGYLVPYTLGGSSEWYNIVPVTKRINDGTTKYKDFVPSMWRVTETKIHRWVQGGGSAKYQVLVAYDLPSTRPTGFGVIVEYLNGYGDVEDPDLQCKGYWYSNDPEVGPDFWNIE